jgi:micrococcal nuclease
MFFVALFLLVISILALIYKVLRRGSLKRWSLVALTSLILIVVFAGITYALFPNSRQERASAPTKTEEEESKQEEGSKQETPAKESEEQETPAKESEEDQPAEEEPAEDEEPNDASSTPAASDADEEDSDSGGHDARVRVKRVVDGDTIEISPAIDGIDEVRLIGVDTPETKEPGCDVQPYGTEASEFTTEELQGEEVDLEFDEDRDDQYDRLLAYVYKDEDMFNETLLEEGYAQVYIVDPNDKYENRFEEAQVEAQAAQRGIWGLSPAQLALLTDRGNGIGGDGCQPKGTPPPPPKAPPTPPRPDADRDGVPDEADTPSAPARPSRQGTPSTPPSSGLPSGGGTGKTCSDFSTQAEAQAALPANPRLDGNKDGEACESLP